MTNDINSEKAIISALLADNSAIYTLAESLHEEDFSDYTCKQIYATALTDPEKFGLLSLDQELRTKARAIVNEGLDYIGQLDKAVVNVTTASFNRRLAVIAENIKNACDNGDPKKLLGDLLEITDKTGRKVVDPELASKRYLEEQTNRFTSERLDLPFKSLNVSTGGLMDGEMWIVAARPSVGKTAFLENIAHSLSQHGKNVLFVSAEMSLCGLMDRFVSRTTKIPTASLRGGTDPKSAKFIDVSKAANQFKLSVLEGGNTTVSDIFIKAKRLQLQHKLDVIFVDYLQKLEGKGDSEYQRVSKISNNLKSMALDLGVPVVVAAQYNRQADNGRPKMADLRDSGNIEQDADVVLSLWIEDQVSDGKDIQQTNIDILKNRQGITFAGGYQLMFKKSETKFYEGAKEPPDMSGLINYSYKDD